MRTGERFTTVNLPRYIDLNTACFMMLTEDLPELFGVMARPANRKVRLRDLSEFDDWLHVISDPIVVRVYAGDTVEERVAFRARVLKTLREEDKIVLTCSTSSLVLSKNQVNVPTLALAEALHLHGAQFCRVGFFGMKWSLEDAEPALDIFIETYCISAEDMVPHGRNLFDYGNALETQEIELLRFSDDQRRARQFREGLVYEKCEVEGYGSLECRPILDEGIVRVKLY